MRSFLKMKSSRNGQIILSFTDEDNHVKVANFYVANISFNANMYFYAIRKNIILTKNSEFTVPVYSMHLWMFMDCIDTIVLWILGLWMHL